MDAVAIITSIIIIIVHVVFHRFGECSVENFDFVPDLLWEKNSTNQRTPYIYKLH